MAVTFLTNKDETRIKEEITSSIMVLGGYTKDGLVTKNGEVLKHGMLFAFNYDVSVLGSSHPESFAVDITINRDKYVMRTIDSSLINEWFSDGDILIVRIDLSMYDSNGSYGTRFADLVSVLKTSKDVELTAESIEEALGYKPADASDIELTPESIEDALGYTPADASGGVEGQFAVSDGNGGITWRTIHNAEEVAY